MQISPGMTHPPSRLCLSDLRRSVPCKYWALVIMATSPRYAASHPLPVRQASALPSASFRFAVARDTLAVRLTLPLAGRVEDFHLRVSAPCRAHHKKARLEEAGWRGRTTTGFGLLGLARFDLLHRRGVDGRQGLALARHPSGRSNPRGRLLRAAQFVGVGADPDEAGRFEHRLQVAHR
jgi:hypothetical protein